MDGPQQGNGFRVAGGAPVTTARRGSRQIEFQSASSRRAGTDRCANSSSRAERSRSVFFRGVRGSSARARDRRQARSNASAAHGIGQTARPVVILLHPAKSGIRRAGGAVEKAAVGGIVKAGEHRPGQGQSEIQMRRGSSVRLIKRSSPVPASRFRVSAHNCTVSARRRATDG